MSNKRSIGAQRKNVGTDIKNQDTRIFMSIPILTVNIINIINT